MGVERTRVPMTAVLCSNSGDASIEFAFGDRCAYVHESGFDASIRLNATHWDGEHSQPGSAAIDGVWLSAGDLSALCDHIRRWVDRPLEALAPEALDGRFDLARLPGQMVALVFGARADTIDSRKPVVSVAIRAGAWSCDLHFVTDPSCLRLFAEALSAALADR